MNQLETSQLLAAISLVDNRTVLEETVVEWHRIIGHINADVARRAMELHFRESTEYLRPAHIVVNARRLNEPKSNDTAPPIPYGRQAAPRPAREAEDAMADGVQHANWPVFLGGVQAYNQQLRPLGIPVVTEIAAREEFDKQIGLMNDARRRAGQPVLEVVES